jgi:hypothetical protein
LHLDRQEEVGDALDLVDDHHVGKVNESSRVGERCLPDLGQVQVAPLGIRLAGDLAEESALPALPGAVNEDDTGVFESIKDGPFSVASQDSAKWGFRYRCHGLHDAT